MSISNLSSSDNLSGMDQLLKAVEKVEPENFREPLEDHPFYQRLSNCVQKQEVNEISHLFIAAMFALKGVQLTGKKGRARCSGMVPGLLYDMQRLIRDKAPNEAYRKAAENKLSDMAVYTVSNTHVRCCNDPPRAGDDLFHELFRAHLVIALHEHDKQIDYPNRSFVTEKLKKIPEWVAAPLSLEPTSELPPFLDATPPIPMRYHWHQQSNTITTNYALSTQLLDQPGLPPPPPKTPHKRQPKTDDAQVISSSLSTDNSQETLCSPLRKRAYVDCAENQPPPKKRRTGALSEILN